MIVNVGLGDDSSGDAGVGPNFNGVYLTFAIIGLFAFVSVFRGNSSSSSYRSQGAKRTRAIGTRASEEYKLEVDITGRGNWVEQATGTKRELGKVATQVKNQEGMKTRLVPL
jgi:hypothetical protein